MMKWAGLAVLILLTAGRLALAAASAPTPEETYYYLCAQHPAAAYFDGPAGTATLVGWLAGMGDFWWRATSPLWAAAATLAAYGLVRRVFDETAGLVAAGLLNVAPVFNFISLEVSPWVAALALCFSGAYFVWRALESERNALMWWIVGGALYAGSVFFSYLPLLLLPGPMLYVLASRKHRRPVDMTGLAILVLAPALAVMPALRWNAEQQWVSFSAVWTTFWDFGLRVFGEGLRGAAGQLSPLVFLAILAGAGLAARNTATRKKARFIFATMLPAAVVAGYLVLRGNRAAEFFLLAAAPLLLGKAWMNWPQGRRWALMATAAVGVMLSVAALPRIWESGRGWPAASAEVKDLFLKKLAEGQASLFLIGQNADAASELNYHLRNDLIPPPGHPAVYVRESQDISSQYGLWPSYDDFVESTKVADENFTEQKGENPFVGRDALYVTGEEAGDLPQTITAAFQSVKLLRKTSLAGRKEPLYIYLCLNYQTLPL